MKYFVTIFLYLTVSFPLFSKEVSSQRNLEMPGGFVRSAEAQWGNVVRFSNRNPEILRF